MGGVETADEQTDETTEGGADGHGGDEDSSGDFAAVGEYDEECADEGGEEEGEDVAPAVGGSTVSFAQRHESLKAGTQNRNTKAKPSNSNSCTKHNNATYKDNTEERKRGTGSEGRYWQIPL